MVGYVILTTFPEQGSGNVGDQLITVSVKRLLRVERKATKFYDFFREDDLTNDLNTINRSRGVVMPGFATRYNMYPKLYRLVENLEKIKCPLVPIGANWSSFPGDFAGRQNFNFSHRTVDFLKYISNQIEYFSCRDYYTCRVLEKHGISNAVMTGDPAWYDLDSMGKKMKRPRTIKKLVFTTPHGNQYTQQAKALIKMLSGLFPKAEKYCSLHSTMNEKDAHIAEYAAKNGFLIKKSSHDIENIEFYGDCDLHVGYRLHGHIAFLRKRIPSILLCEDGRGVGFSHTVGGIGCFEAFSRRLPDSISNVLATLPVRGFQFVTRTLFGYQFIDKAIAPANMLIVEQIHEFIEEELDTRFRRYLGLSEYFDETYQLKMKPFLHSIP